MQESCPNCGAELYGGQQFCRRCGTPVGAAAGGGEAPTQLFNEGAHTEGVAGQRPTEYQTSAGQQTSALVGHPFGAQPLAVGAPPARRRRRGVWLFALLAVFVLGAGLASGAAFIWWRATHRGTVVKIVKTGPQGAPAVPAVPPVPEVPEIPADLGERIKEALKGASVGLPLDESGAVVSGDDTILTRTFKLDPSASFTAHVMSGNITVVGADADGAVVKIVKHGGSVQERAATRVLAAETEEGIMLLGTPPNGRVSVSFEVRVPRGLRRLDIAVNKGDVRVSEFAGAVSSKVINGNTRVSIPAAERAGAQEFTVVKGDIEATLADGAGADLQAESLTGDINLDDDFGLHVERGPVGRHVSGHLGEGGDTLLLKVVNGDIKLKK
jgi:hypothetical protein